MSGNAVAVSESANNGLCAAKIREIECRLSGYWSKDTWDMRDPEWDEIPQIDVTSVGLRISCNSLRIYC